MLTTHSFATLLLTLPALLGHWHPVSNPAAQTFDVAVATQVQVKAESTSAQQATTQKTHRTSTQDKGSATLVGRVTYSGPSIPPRQIQINKDEKICSKGDTIIPEVELSDDGGVAGVVVELIGIEEPESGWEWKQPDDGYVIRQKSCGFVPRMLVMPNGTELTVFNDDPVAHNVNTGQFNQMQPGGAPPITKEISSRRPIRVTCNIHSWMEGWIYPAQSPFFAVTDELGSFSMPNVPPGTYRGTAWHPYLGKQRLSVTLSDGETQLDIQFNKK